MFDHEKNVGTQSTTTAEQNPASAVSSIVTAQVELCAVMSQCMLTWATLPIEMMLSTSRQDTPRVDKADVQKASPVNHPTASYQVATPTGFAWLASPPIITGIEDTVNDQVFQPRPRETQQRDILKLWERSNEFGSKAHARKPAGPSATHSQAA